jgi:hypothetical protein
LPHLSPSCFRLSQSALTLGKAAGLGAFHLNHLARITGDASLLFFRQNRQVFNRETSLSPAWQENNSTHNPPVLLFQEKRHIL